MTNENTDLLQQTGSDAFIINTIKWFERKIKPVDEGEFGVAFSSMTDLEEFDIDTIANGENYENYENALYNIRLQRQLLYTLKKLKSGHIGTTDDDKTLRKMFKERIGEFIEDNSFLQKKYAFEKAIYKNDGSIGYSTEIPIEAAGRLNAKYLPVDLTSYAQFNEQAAALADKYVQELEDAYQYIEEQRATDTRDELVRRISVFTEAVNYRLDKYTASLESLPFNGKGKSKLIKYCRDILSYRVEKYDKLLKK